MHILRRINWHYTRLTNFKTRLAIKKKWAQDLKRLPLTAAHWELYEIIHRLCLKELGEFPNLVDCRDFNDKIQWLKLFDQDVEIIRCSDKILVRDYVRERVGEEYLVELYQVHDHFDEIDFDALPKSFVIKTNHDSGTVILVRDKYTFDRNEAGLRIMQALKRPYGWNNAEWAYSYINPKVLVEEFIEFDVVKSPPDYKFHCVNGEVKWLQYIYDRGFNTKECILDSEGRIQKIHFDNNMQHSGEFKKPDSWDMLLKCAEKLSKGHKYLRVDLFSIDGKIYVGELTFYPLMGCYTGRGQKDLGRLLDFDRTTYKPFLIEKLEETKSRFAIFTNS